MALRLLRGARQLLPGFSWGAGTGVASVRAASTPAKTGQKPSGFRMTVDAAGYRPDEVSVSLSGRVLTVEGQRTRLTETGRFSSSLFRRVWLPEYVQAGALTSRLTPDGKLVVEAPVEQEQKRVEGGDAATAEDKKGSESAKSEKGESAKPATSEGKKSSEGEVASSDGEEEEEMFRVETDVGDFSPDEVTVRVADGVVTVEAVREETTQTGTASLHLLRRFLLPDHADPGRISFHRTEDGTLVVEAPVMKHENQESAEDKEIPVRRD